MTQINLPCFGIVVSLTGDGGGNITSDMHEETGDFYDDSVFNTGVDAIESMVLAHAIAGIDIESPAYVEGIETALLALAHYV